MKFIASLLVVVASAAEASIDASSDIIPANSAIGQRLLSVSRRLENNQDGDMSWASSYSLKFDKCATTNEYYGGYFGGNGNNNNNQQQNNNNGNRNGYNGLYEQRLVHFKLCPTDTCSKGCSGGGDYVVDMNEYVRAYFEYKQQLVEAQCESVKENCDCENANDDQVCESACIAQAGLSDVCEEQGGQNNNNNNGQYQFNLQEAVDCSRLEIDESVAAQYYNYGQNDGYNNYNNYNQNNNQNNQNNKIEFFVGPYCAAAGRSIFLGVFMDETCSYAAPENVYTKLTGTTLPYSTTSIIGHDCLSCKDTSADAEVEYDENGNEEVAVLKLCEELYQGSGKCETNLAAYGHYPTTYACDFIKGLNAWGKTRIAAEYQEFARHITPGVLAGVFACTTLIFGGVSYFIHTKMSSGGRKQSSLMEDNAGIAYVTATDSRYA